MAENILVRIQQGQLQALEDAVTSWTTEYQQAQWVRGVEGVVRMCLDIPRNMRLAYYFAWELVLAQQIDDFCATGESLLQLMNRGLQTLDRVRNWARPMVQTTDRDIKGVAELDKAITDLEQLKHECETGWPFFSQKDIEDGRAEDARGELLELDEAFAQMAGVDKATWLKRVEEHKRSKRQ